MKKVTKKKKESKDFEKFQKLVKIAKILAFIDIIFFDLSLVNIVGWFEVLLMIILTIVLVII